MSSLREAGRRKWLRDCLMAVRSASIGAGTLSPTGLISSRRVRDSLRSREGADRRDHPRSGISTGLRPQFFVYR